MEEEKNKMTINYIDDIIKSPNDDRQYRGLELPNKLKVLLISQPNTGISAAAMRVDVGHISDPDDLPGLAHFCEHALFMGSNKYPDQNDFTKYLTEHGGETNARTLTAYTLYHFDVLSEHLEGALDRFAQSFTSPLFTEDSINLEINSVHSEWEKNVPDDYSRLEQLRRSLSKNGHPYQKFGTGNKTTLMTSPEEKGIDVRKELVNFYEKWYSSNIMTLVVLGERSLKKLEQMVVKYFSDIPNKNLEPLEWTDHPYGPDQLQTKIYVSPLKDVRELQINFPIPDQRKYHQADPCEYAIKLLSDVRPGSLHSTLSERYWCEYLYAEEINPGKGFSFFRITFELTESGFEKIDQVIYLFFQYLNMIKEKTLQKWIFEENQKIAKNFFELAEKGNTLEYVVMLVTALQYHPMKEILPSSYYTKEWKPYLIEELLDQLKPSNAQIMIIGQKFETILNEIEPWYGTKYKTEKISKDLIKKWENCGTNNEFKLPEPNEFISSDIEILGKKRHPLIIKEDSSMRVWFKRDDEFLVPKAYLAFKFLSPIISVDALNENFMDVYVDILSRELKSPIFDASKAGVFCKIKTMRNGFHLFVDGFSEKLHVLLDKILEKAVSLKIEPSVFEIVKEEQIRRFKNYEAQQPADQVALYLNYLIYEKCWTLDELLKAYDKVTVESLEELIPQFFSKMHIECLLHGNLDKTRALSLVEIVENRLKSKISMSQEMQLVREIKFKNRVDFIFEKDNRFHKSSCVLAYYQCGVMTTENKILTSLLHQVLKEPCFDTLRTKEQLGYEVSSYVKSSSSAQGLIITVQSEKHPSYVNRRIEAFLIQMRDVIEKMDEEEFERHKETLVSGTSATLADLAGRFWDEIDSREYNFNRRKIESAYVRTVEKSQVLKFYDDHIRHDGMERRKLSVHVISQVEGGAGNLPESDFENLSFGEDSGNLPSYIKIVKIKDVEVFKRSCELYPLTEPYVDIGTLVTEKKIINVESELENGD